VDILSGNVWRFEDNIDTDLIIAARYLNTSNPKELAKYVMEDSRSGFANIISNGDMIVAGENFGCGSSREHAPIALKEAGISVVIAKSFARIFYRNAFNVGLIILEVPDSDTIKEGDDIEVDISSGIINNRTNKCTYSFKEIPEFMKQLLEVGGLINYSKKRFLK
jgi:3-isopropylmalate/(R)-2-methylmalate dehydratase small subunit